MRHGTAVPAAIGRAYNLDALSVLRSYCPGQLAEVSLDVRKKAEVAQAGEQALDRKQRCLVEWHEGLLEALKYEIRPTTAKLKRQRITDLWRERQRWQG